MILILERAEQYLSEADPGTQDTHMLDVDLNSTQLNGGITTDQAKDKARANTVQTRRKESKTS